MTEEHFLILVVLVLLCSGIGRSLLAIGLGLVGLVLVFTLVGISP
jgi:hypothetical protein